MREEPREGEAAEEEEEAKEDEEEEEEEAKEEEEGRNGAGGAPASGRREEEDADGMWRIAVVGYGNGDGESEDERRRRKMGFRRRRSSGRKRRSSPPEEEEGRKGAGGVLNLRTGAAAGAAGGLWSPAWAAAAVHLAGSRLATVLEQVWPKQVRCSVGCRLHGYHGRFSAGRCCCRCSLIHACNGRAVEFLSVAVAGGARASWTGLDGLE